MTLGPGVHLLRPSQAGVTVDAVPTATMNVWMHVNSIPYGVDYYVRYPSTAPAGRIVVLDAGPFGVFSGLNSRGITIQHGQTIQLRRTNSNAFAVISPTTGVVARSGSANFASTPRRILIVGQSLGKQWEYMTAAGAFLDKGAILGSLPYTAFYHFCTGGSAALHEYRPDYWWYDLDTGAPGPLLISVIQAIMSLQDNEKPTHVLWVQGEQDSGHYAGTTTVEDDVFRTRYQTAVGKIIDAIRVHCNMAAPRSIPAYIQILGPRASGESRGMPLVRDAQWNLINTVGANILVGAEPPTSIPLADDVHPNAAGYTILGELTALAFDA